MKQESLRSSVTSQVNTAGNISKPILITTIAFVFMIGLVVLGVYSTLALPIDEKRRLLNEGGIIESACVWLYILTGLGLLAVGGLQWSRRSAREQQGSTFASQIGPAHPWMLAAFVFCFAARELDFQKRFTTMSVTKTRFFVSSDVGIVEKLIVFLVLAAIALLVFRLFAIYFQKIISRFKNCRLAGVLPVLAVLSVVFATALDSVSILKRGPWEKGIPAAEEMSELLIPVLFLAMFAITVLPSIFRKEAGAGLEEQIVTEEFGFGETKKAA